MNTMNMNMNAMNEKMFRYINNVGVLQLLWQEIGVGLF